MVLTQEDWNSISHLEQKWKGFKMSGNVDLSDTEKEQIDRVYKKIFDIKEEKGFCHQCPGSIMDAFTKTFTHYERNRQPEPQPEQGAEPENRTPRQRLRSAQDLLGWVKDRL